MGATCVNPSLDTFLANANAVMQGDPVQPTGDRTASQTASTQVARPADKRFAAGHSDEDRESPVQRRRTGTPGPRRR